MWLIGVWHQLHFHDACPLNVLFAFFMFGNRAVGQHDRLLNTSDDEVPELLLPSIKRSNMPTQAGVDQRKRHDFTLGSATADGVVKHLQGATAMNSTGDSGQCVQRGTGDAGWCFASHPGLQWCRFPIPKSLCQPRQYTLGWIVEQWLKSGRQHITLSTAVITNVSGR